MAKTRGRNRNNTRTKSVKNGILLAVLLVFIIAIIGSTYSRYVSTGTAETTGEIAKWNVKIGNTNLSEVENFELTARSVAGISNENVSENKLAPGQTLVTDSLVVNPAGSEVAIDYILSVGEVETQGFNTNSTIEATKIMATLDGAEAVEVGLVDGKYTFYETLEDVLAGKKATFVAHISWTDEGNNTADTENGAGVVTSVQVPVEITARQHLEEDGFVSAVSVDTVTELEAAISNLSAGDTLALSRNVNYEGNYDANAYHQVELPNNFTLDLNGKTLASTNGSVLLAADGLTIKNGTLNGLADSYGRTYMTIWNYSGKASNITLNNVTVTGGLNFYNTENVVLNNCNVTSGSNKFYALYGNEKGNGVTTITINGGTYTAGSNAKALFGYNGEGNPTDGFKIYGGTFNTNGKPFCLTSGKHIPPVIYGGTFDCDVSSYVADGHTCTSQGNGTWVVE